MTVELGSFPLAVEPAAPRAGRWRAGVARVQDVVDDVLVELASRRARALLMVVAVGLSTGALQASVGISTQAAQQIGADIAASTLDLTSVSVVPTGDGPGGADAASASEVATILPADTEERLAGIDLVDSGGRRLDVSGAASPVVTRLPGGDEVGRGEGEQQLDVVAVTSGYLRAARTEAPTASTFLLDGDTPVVLLGPGAAEALDVPVVDDPTGLQVWIDGQPYDVVGFVGGAGPAALENAVVMPYARGLATVGRDDDASVLVRALPGAGAQVASVVAQAVRPDAPERLSASSVVSMSTLRRGVSTQMDKLAAWTGTVLMVLTILLIANSMIVAVTSRTTEIGLRRALGCSRAQVGAVFLAEGMLIGFLGGLVGAAIAATSVVAAAALNGWSAVLSPGWIAVGPLIGVAVGLVASAYPARRAATISPALAVRSE
ncbi:putative ABC transport system permease protein [Sediminihabitans luteus]|uniref:Putative ABC transport system permease protein n=1 Tax=Sediminihabitans luteus TaxID=1138585 RepID=A0A2M9CBU5_9CELL|nr:ABC transporter permease [Sediminihabitans luteus]PJJ68544.1 putative ABC transport system permease protein [Sediminihabitans luteus]GII99879.1 ABC transporter permease [Sediminihabitans luteus]